ncbi:hypothetical protein EWM64_g6208 [Hericium alpestre]|uniref:Uncharacterized protein n=1 Tax=Hericium alpestre TaxID=135208 RepID=A0A4Y9ZUE4_9AGAM|nr:hypothetical protein EWM64_g6208 [Hericium alpestre]
MADEAATKAAEDAVEGARKAQEVQTDAKDVQGMNDDEQKQQKSSGDVIVGQQRVVDEVEEDATGQRDKNRMEKSKKEAVQDKEKDNEASLVAPRYKLPPQNDNRLDRDLKWGKCHTSNCRDKAEDGVDAGGLGYIQEDEDTEDEKRKKTSRLNVKKAVSFEDMAEGVSNG